VVYPDPGFPIYESAINWVGADSGAAAAHEERDFVFDPAELEARLSRGRSSSSSTRRRTRPEGGRAGGPERRRPLIEQTGAVGALGRGLLGDALEGSSRRIATEPGMLERTILLGRLLVDVRDEPAGLRLRRGARAGGRSAWFAFFVNSTSCVPPFVQLAGIAALQGPWNDIAAMMAEFRAPPGARVERPQ